MPITTIKEQFKKVIQYSQEIEEPKIDDLFNQWLEAKRDIIEAWNGKYIIESEIVSFELDKAEKRSRLCEFIDTVINQFGNDALADFLEWASLDEIFTNRLEREYYLPDGVKIPKGTKLIRAFKYFEPDDFLLRELQDRLSMILQEDKVSGTLCFSVHPLDFISASENNYHWRSCHALDGDYRAGNLSYMLDKSTIICYLKRPGELVKLPHFPEDVLWNSKKWRMWLFLSDDWGAMFAGRQYPFFSRSALDILQKPLLLSLKNNNRYWSNWHKDFIKSFPREEDDTPFGTEGDLDGRHIAMNYNIYKMKELVSDCYNPLHFNDLLESSCYIPYYCWSRVSKSKKLHFSIGHQVPCLRCNKEYIHHANLMVCDTCELKFGTESNEHFSYCECCDSRCLREEMRFVEGEGVFLCSDCYENLISECEQCHDMYYKNNLSWNDTTKKWNCHYCFKGLNNEEIDWDNWLPF